MKEIIPVRHGGKYANIEAYANLKTGQVEDTYSWDKGPSNNLLSEFTYLQRPSSEAYAESWERVFGRKANG